MIDASSRTGRRLVGLAPMFAALVAAQAVAAASLPADNGPTLEVVANGSLHELVLDGRVSIHTTTDEIVSEKLIALPDSETLLVLWEQVNAAGERLPYYAIRLDGQPFGRVRQTSYDILLRHARFDPLTHVPEVEPSLAADGDHRIFIVQFHTQPLEEFRSAIRTLGGTVHRYLGNHAHVVEMSAETMSKVEALPYVRWVGPFHPAYRFEEYLRDNLGQADTLFPMQRYNIMVFEPRAAQKVSVAAKIQAVGGTVDNMLKGSFLLEATLTPDQLVAAIRWDEVLFIDRWTPMEEDMNIARDIGGADFLENETGFSGQGVRGEVLDTYLFTAHQDFQHHPPILHGPNSGGGTHGTKSYGINFGDGTGDSRATGMLPDGQGIFADWNYLNNRFQHTSELVQDPYFAVFQTASVGNLRNRQYTNISAEMDDILFTFDLLACQSQSNAGNQDSRPQAWAKNMVSVGGVYHYDTPTRADDCWCHGASIGPASDGRIKPDFTHFYDSVYTTSGAGYGTHTGTSSATPITAGHFGLFFQMWSEGIFGNPTDPEGTVFENRSHMTTAKAMMVNTATQYDFTGRNHDKTRIHQGWGMIDVARPYDLRDRFFIIDESVVLSNLQVARHIVTVEPGEPDFKATLVYADPAGVPYSQRHRINDLTLKVISPSQTVYWGNNGLLDGNWSTPGGVANTIDTVENVFVENPEPGDWTVEVYADEINEDSHVETPEVDADYALVVSPVTLDIVVLCPLDLTIIRGVPISGGFGELCASDDSRLVVQQGITQNPEEPPVWFELTGSSPTDAPAEMRFTLEARVSTPATTQTVSLFNYVTDEFEEVDARPSTMNDSVANILIDGDPSRFIDPETLEVKAQLTWMPGPLVIVFPWTVGVDQAIWTIRP